jgi:GNAT superfamily N-acetyltransferase
MPTTRTPDGGDIDALVALIHAADLVYDPEATRYTAEEIGHDWERISLADDAWVVLDDGVVCGYATLTPRLDIGRLFADGYTHPDFDGRGVGTLLLRRIHERAAGYLAEPADTRLVLVNNVMCGGTAQRLLEAKGYALARVHQRMHRSLADDVAGDPAEPVWPEGVSVATCDGGGESIRAAYECVEEAFADHWGRPRRTYADWSAYMVYEGFDPSLWMLAVHGGRLVGVSLCRTRDGVGEVDMLGVLRPWRGLGIGEALLWHSFGEMRRRGLPGVGLGVDSTSLTGADRLYARVGMAVTSRIGRFEMELRPGRDPLAEQAITV